MKYLLLLLLLPVAVSAWWESLLEDIEELNNVNSSIVNMVPSYDELLMNRVCARWVLNWMVSPLCWNRDLFRISKEEFESKWVPHEIALGIMLAESHIWINYAGTCNQSWNNWWWIKWKLTDIGWRVKDQIIPNNWNNQPWWCWLYKFDSLQEYFRSKANTLSIWYGECFKRDNPITCISRNYVWRSDVAEKSRINNVQLIATTYE